MKKHKAGVSYVDSPESALTHWWGTHANRVDEANPEELLMSVAGLERLSDIMSDEGALFPLPFVVYRHCTLGKKYLANHLPSMFARRNLEAPARVGLPRVRSDHRGQPTTCIAYSSGEVFEWIWDVIAQHLNSRLISLLPHTSELRGMKKGMGATQIAAEVKGMGWPHSESEFVRAAQAISSALPIRTQGMLEPQSIEEVLDVISEGITVSSQVDINREVLKDHIAPLCLQFEPTVFLGKTLMRADVMEEIIGTTFARQLRAHVFQDDWRIDAVSTITPAQVTQHLLQELLDTRHQLLNIKAHVARGDFASASRECGSTLVQAAVVDHANTPDKSRGKWQGLKSHQMRKSLFDAASDCIECNAALRHISHLIARVEERTLGTTNVLAPSVTRHLKEFIVTLNDAVQLHATEYLNKALLQINIKKLS